MCGSTARVSAAGPKKCRSTGRAFHLRWLPPAHRPGPAGIVDKHINQAETGHRLVHNRLAALGVGDIQRQRARLVRMGRHKLVQAIGPARRSDDRVPGGERRLGQCPAETGCRTCDQPDPAGRALPLAAISPSPTGPRHLPRYLRAWYLLTILTDDGQEVVPAGEAGHIADIADHGGGDDRADEGAGCGRLLPATN